MSSKQAKSSSRPRSLPPTQADHSPKAHPLKRLLDYGQNYHRQVRWAIACSILNKVFDLTPSALIGTAIDIVVQQQRSVFGRLGIQNLFTQLVILSLLTFSIWGLESAFQYAYDRLWRNLAQNIQHNLRLDAYAHLQELELAYFEERSTGELLSILNDDINQLERFLNGGANDLLQVSTTAIIISSVFFILAPSVAWMAMLPMPFIVWGSVIFQRRLAPRYADMREKVGLLNGRLSNNLSGITTIKSFATEAYETERIARDSEAYRQSNRRAITLSAAFIPLIRMLVLVGFLATLLYGGKLAIAGSLSVGSYSVLIFLTQSLLWPLTRLGETFDLYQRAMASTKRVMDLLDTPIAIHSGHLALGESGQRSAISGQRSAVSDQASVTGPLRTTNNQTTSSNQNSSLITQNSSIQGDIHLHDVTFAYADREPVIERLSLHIPAGETTAIVGATGSGKSTLVKLLLRLYEVQSGTITLDGVDLRDLALPALRRAIGWVNQDVFLFHGTVAENIAYGSFEATSDEIIAAAEIAEAHEFIQQLPQGYDTIVGERGQKLSGGQRQRLAIARAILKDPPILILDEATSAVDNETEAAIQRSLERITVGRTTIAIAHRLSTVRNANCIYVMAQGKIAERGQHDRLLQQQGIYASLWQIQTGSK
ncbi:ABC transporter ATP-binding protein [Stenomitos frigidus]|uniref:ABC transporter n=1 Tax=Stenomitos frigidus ULC18 TaxID=2107698 RepID=A0A2T1EHM4_9CYAN|nr:ABC transporter [Stenomitos frigidus ULC18]